MIIVVHSLFFVFRYALRWYRREQTRAAICRESQSLQEAVGKPAALPLDPEECLVFAIPVYRQRYSTVQDVLLDPRWRVQIKRVVDFGCAEFGFFQYVKHLLGITHILEVDIDELLLKDNMFRVQPLTADYLKQRSDPLTVEICSGSVADPDWRIQGIDAVVGIEIIEHLYPDTLDALPFNIFGYAQPKVAIFTTPNADFNVLFPNFKGFRHDDHKFEWSREQFEAWALNIVERFPNYTVTFAGIGKGPKGTESLGCCSQMAVFVKEYDVVRSEVPELAVGGAPDACALRDWSSAGVCTHYSFSHAQKLLLAEDLLSITPNAPNASGNCDRRDEFYRTIEIIKYPYTEDIRTADEKLLYEATQRIFMHATQRSRYFNEDTGIVEIPLYEIVHNFEGNFATEAEIQRILEAADFKVAACAPHGTDERCLCVLYDITMAGRSSHTASEYEDEEDNDEEQRPAQAQDAHQRNINTGNDSDWELEERGARAPHAKDEAATPSDPLVDSGYQKSLSNAEWSPQSPIDGHFDEHFMPKMDVNDIKDSIRGGTAVAGGPSKAKSPLPGTSRRRKASSIGAARRSESEDSSNAANEDVKCIADVLMYNSLNRLDILDVPHVEQVVLPVERPRDLEIPPPAQFIVENGDLANNNRDGEGNNYAEQQPDGGMEGLEHDANENVGLVAHAQEQDHENRNGHAFDNRNLDDGIVADVEPAQPVQNPVVEIVDVHAPEPPPEDEEDEELNHASREALFDPNSLPDMLDDADGSITDDTADFEHDAEADADVEGAVAEAESALPVNNLFPNWLLQLLGSASYVAAAEDDDDAVEAGAGDEDGAHFYCQGDGIGVHPSIAEVDIDTSSSSSSTDVAQAERTISENDAGSLPADGVATWSMASTSDSAAAAAALAIFGRALDIPLVMLEQTSSNMSQDSAEEFFDTVAEPVAMPPAPPRRSRGPDLPDAEPNTNSNSSSNSNSHANANATSNSNSNSNPNSNSNSNPATK